jgi:AcrR family transcriptional regulator
VNGSRRSSSGTRTAAPRGGKANTSSRPRRDLVEKQILEHATALFAERGFAGTSLQDIADAIGLTRPALYHYVPSKDELLGRLICEIEEPAAILADINAQTDLEPADRLHEIVTVSALHRVAAPERFRLIVRSEAELPESLSKGHERSRRRVLKEFIKVIQDGIDAGVFRPVDPRLAALGMIGMINWIAWWYRADHDESGESIAASLADMAVSSVLHERLAPVSSGGATAAIAALRQNLDYLEQHVKATRETRT